MELGSCLTHLSILHVRLTNRLRRILEWQVEPRFLFARIPHTTSMYRNNVLNDAPPAWQVTVN